MKRKQVVVIALTVALALFCTALPLSIVEGTAVDGSWLSALWVAFAVSLAIGLLSLNPVYDRMRAAAHGLIRGGKKSPPSTADGDEGTKPSEPERDTHPRESQALPPSPRPRALKEDLQEALAEGRRLRQNIPGPLPDVAFYLAGHVKATSDDITQWENKVGILLEGNERLLRVFLSDPPRHAGIADKTVHGLVISPLQEHLDYRLSQLEWIIRRLER